MALAKLNNNADNNTNINNRNDNNNDNRNDDNNHNKRGGGPITVIRVRNNNNSTTDDSSCEDEEVMTEEESDERVNFVLQQMLLASKEEGQRKNLLKTHCFVNNKIAMAHVLQFNKKPKETEVVAKQDASVKVDESKGENKEIDEQDNSEKGDANEGGEEKLNIESKVQTGVKSKTVETTFIEEGVFNLELEGSFNVNNNDMDCDIQTEATPEIGEETKEIEVCVTNLLSLVTQYDMT
ncbi:probable WRKY transcription factor protein 1 [Trifolium pratense]|uniref:probable WRKY transcription factor protein 1 n=1 Tax=Trifolium pratense TaxID=57577 RepID=UPI001E692862|nr:probable WRKY transcription factor protein 1 [Trifolium pratense]